MTARKILLADADAFFVAVARLTDPDGVGKEPLLVVGGSAKGRGVVTSASYETRIYGVRSGMPMAQALRLCPQLVRTPVPGKACREKSRAIRATLEQFTPIVQAASIDEFYLDMTGTDELYAGETLRGIAQRIRAAVLQETGIAVSIGGGSSKFIAKLAAKHAKPHRRSANGVHIVPPGDEREFLAQQKLADIPGIGPRLQERLARHDLRDVRQIMVLDEETLVSNFGDRTGKWLFRRVRGIDTSSVVTHTRAKSMSHEQTFAADLYHDRDLDQRLTRLASRVAAELRSKNRMARTVTVKLRDADFTTRQASKTLKQPVDSDQSIASTARQLLRKLRDARRTGARLLGVAVSHFDDEREQQDQLSLFENPEESASVNERDRRLTSAVDSINTRFGTERIVRGSTVNPNH
ncbi:MAG: DNA polymerase IV [Gemmatimonadota bacterium]|nr:MAG: DNA polymerase IV [Gemmatimonadota bacterium]